MIHKNIRVSGRVQGVFYRASTADVAKSLGLNGYVMNELSGTVYIEVEGEEPVIEQLIEWTRTGPPRAEVTGVDITDGPVIGFHGFEIRR